MQTFYNTIHLSGEELKQAVADAESQEEAIYLLFQSGCKLSASDVFRLTQKAGREWPLHSNRRALTNLKTSGRLVKTSETKIGLYGKREFKYMINQKTA